MDDPEKTPEQIAIEADAAAAVKATNDKATNRKAAAEKPPEPEAKPPVEEKAPLRTDGPTLAEFVDAGYPAESYPPPGYAAKEEEPVRHEVNRNTPRIDEDGNKHWE